MKILTVHDLPTITAPAVGIDLETTSTPGRKISNPWQDRIISIQVSDGETAWVLPPGSNFRSVVPTLNNPDIKKIGHNIAFDLAFLIQQLEAAPVNVYDTMLMSRLIYAGKDMRHSLDAVLAVELGVNLDKSTRAQFAQHTGQLTDEQLHYIVEDVAHLNKLREVQIPKVSGAGMGKIAAIENKAVLAFTDLYLTGVHFDKELWKEYEQLIDRRVGRSQMDFIRLTDCGYAESMFAGVEPVINLGSVKQLKTFFEKRGMNLANTQEATLVKYVENHPGTEEGKIVETILDYKHWRKMLGWSFNDEVNPVTGCIHPSWNQMAAGTGRVSCSGPNLQQVPRPEKDSPINFRHLFTAKEGHSFITADFSQQEVRVLAQLCGDRDLRSACEHGDVYSQIAKQVYGKEVEKGSEERFLMKTAVLACAYGAREKKLAYVLSKTEEEAGKLRQMIFQTYPGIKLFADNQLRKVVQQGYTTTQLGRRRYFPEAATAKPDTYWKFASAAVNSPVQGTAADIGKLALLKIRDYYKETKDIRPVLVIHDECVLQAPKDKAEEVKYQLIGAMEEASSDICPDVKIYVECGISDAWDKV